MALFSRIRFLRLLYAALQSIMKKDLTSIQEADRYLASCIELVCIMQETIGRGIKPKVVKDEDGNKGNFKCLSYLNANFLILCIADYPTIMGFEPLINQRLLPPTFPRYTRLRTRKEAMGYLEEMVVRIKHCTKITHCTVFHTSLVRIFIEFLEITNVIYLII